VDRLRQSFLTLRWGPTPRRCLFLSAVSSPAQEFRGTIIGALPINALNYTCPVESER